MKIGNSTDSVQADIAARAANGTRSPAAGSQEVAGSAPVDRIELSATSRSMAAEGSQAPVRSDKVAEVRAAIDAGTFNVSSQVVAEKMISAAAELLQTITR